MPDVLVPFMGGRTFLPFTKPKPANQPVSKPAAKPAAAAAPAAATAQ